MNSVDNIAVGPRHKKLDLAFEKALESTIGQCDLEEVKKAFPSFPEGEEVLKISHSKALEFFMEGMRCEWKAIMEQFDMYNKLDKLDDALLDESGEKLANLFQMNSPTGFIYTQAIPENKKEISDLNRQLEEVESENKLLTSHIESKKILLDSKRAKIKKVESAWNNVFEVLNK